MIIMEKLRIIIEKSDKLSLRQLRLEFNDEIIKEIKAQTSEELYDNFMSHYKRTYNEIIYGNNDENTFKVKQDFLKSIEDIIRK